MTINPIDVRTAIADAVEAYLAAADRSVDNEQLELAAAALLPAVIQADDPDSLTALADTAHRLADAVSRATAAATAPSVPTIEPAAAPGGDAATAPDLAVGPDGTVLACWLEFRRGHGDLLRLARRCPDGSWTEIDGDEPCSDLLAPRLTIAGNDAAVIYSRWSDGRWATVVRNIADAGLGPATDLLPDSRRTVGATAAFASDGTLHVAIQSADENGWFRIGHLSRTPGGEWSDPTWLSETGRSCWDPHLAVQDDGRVAVVWSRYDGRCYRLQLRQCDPAGQWSTVRELTAPAENHALHPHLTADADRLWLAFDTVQIPNEAGSGLTGYRRSTEIGDDRPPHNPVAGYGVSCGIEVMTIDADGTVRVPPGELPRQAAAASFPRVTIVDGRPFVLYRRVRQLPFRDYVAHLCVRGHDGTGWGAPTVLPGSAGMSLPGAAAAVDAGLLLLAGGDGHPARHVAMIRDVHDGASDPEPDPDTGDGREDMEVPIWFRMAPGGHLGCGSLVAGLLTVSGDRPDIGGWPARTPPEPVSDNGSADSGADSRTDPATDSRTDPATGRRTVWADLHRHSNVSRCGAGLDLDHVDHYKFSEDVRRLDVSALTDHAENTSDFNWRQIVKLATVHDRPGRFSAMPAYEWTSFAHGHQNVVFAADSGPILSTADPTADDPAKLWSRLAGQDCLTIPHHPAAYRYATDWSYRNATFAPVVEVFQAATGSYESPWCPRQNHDATAGGATVQEALLRGHRVGIIASTDHRYGASYAGIVATELDRRPVLDALRSRNCFGASRRGIVPELSYGGAPMGSEVVEDAAAELRFGGQGIAELAVVQLIRDGVVVAESPRPAGQGVLTVPIDLRMESTRNGPRDWSGELVVSRGSVLPTEFVNPEVRFVSPDRVAWATALPSSYGGLTYIPGGGVVLGFTVSGDQDTEIVVTAAGLRSSFMLEQIAAHPQQVDGDRCTLRIRAGNGGLQGIGVDHWSGVADCALVTSGSWYYTRVIQADGEMAWSSPIWID